MEARIVRLCASFPHVANEPGKPVSTPPNGRDNEPYAVLRFELTASAKDTNILGQCLESGDIEGLGAACFNDLEAVVLRTFRRVQYQARLATARGRWCVHVWQRTKGAHSLFIVGRGARGRFCSTAERMGWMGMP